MPYSREAEFYHHRQRHPSEFKKSSLKTVPISHTEYRGKKYAKKGVKAVVGKHKPSGKWKIASILEPKKKRRGKR